MSDCLHVFFVLDSSLNSVVKYVKSIFIVNDFELCSSLFCIIFTYFNTNVNSIIYNVYFII